MGSMGGWCRNFPDWHTEYLCLATHHAIWLSHQTHPDSSLPQIIWKHLTQDKWLDHMQITTYQPCKIKRTAPMTDQRHTSYPKCQTTQPSAPHEVFNTVVLMGNLKKQISDWLPLSSIHIHQTTPKDWDRQRYIIAHWWQGQRILEWNFQQNEELG